MNDLLHIHETGGSLAMLGLMEGFMGRPRMFTDEQRREKRRIKSAKWRAENPERARAIGREAMRRAAAEKAIAEGREPGKRGRPRLYTEEEKRAKRKAKSEKWNAAHLERTRKEARERGQAKRDGTFVSRALPRLTAEQRRLSELVFSAKRRGRLRKAFGRPTVEDIERLYELQAGICSFCGKTLNGDIHVDHWLPLSKGGSADRLNLRLLHENCNLVKGARHPSEFPLLQPTVLLW